MNKTTNTYFNLYLFEIATHIARSDFTPYICGIKT